MSGDLCLDLIVVSCYYVGVALVVVYVIWLIIGAIVFVIASILAAYLFWLATFIPFVYAGYLCFEAKKRSE